MKKLLLAALLCLPFSAIAANGHLYAIKFEPVEGRSFAEHQAITADFNK